MRCFNRKVLTGAGVVALGVLLFAPRMLGAVLPLLVVAICPLSMLLMMRAMSGSGNRCQTGGSAGQPTARDADAEIATLQAEIDRLQAEKAENSAERAPRQTPSRP